MAKRRRRYQSPDGVDWRDPDMPVLVFHKILKKPFLISASDRQLLSQRMMNEGLFGSYKTDPTYNVRRRKCRPQS